MKALIPQVHLFLCLDDRVTPGVILQLLDMARVQEWQEELILICDESWKPFVNVDQPVMFLDKNKFFAKKENLEGSYNLDYLEEVLDQLDHFEIKKVTQIGNLQWGRWLKAYLEGENGVNESVVEWDKNKVSALQVLNDVADELGIDISSSDSQTLKSNDVFIDPYEADGLSNEFTDLLANIKSQHWPDWLFIVVKEEDEDLFKSKDLEDQIILENDISASHTNQSVLCFSSQSPFVQTSRNYNVALYNCEGKDSLFLPGDISIQSTDTDHLSEIINILTYWKLRRLKELSFQWLNMGIVIHHLEIFHSRVVQRNLLNYSLDLFHCEILIDSFIQSNGRVGSLELRRLVDEMRSEIDNDPYSLSFSLKILNMIVDRMLASAQVGERLFQRLGSDYHRIIIGEALIEGLIENHSKKIADLDVKAKLSDFKQFLLLVDRWNDEGEQIKQLKEPQ